MNKKGVIPNIIIGLGILAAAIIISASFFSQKVAISERTMGQDQAAIRILGIEGQGALTYLDNAAELAAAKAKREFDASGGLEEDFEGGGYPCGSFLGRAYWYNNGQSCAPPFEETLTNHYQAALVNYLASHPFFSYPGFTYTLTPYADGTTGIKGKGVRGLLFGTSFQKNDFTFYQKTSFTADYPEALTPIELNYGSRGGKAIENIVVHYTVTKNANDALKVLQARGLSYHYLIDHDGTVYQAVPETGSAWHGGCSVQEKGPSCLLPGMNQPSIGISFANCGHDKNCQNSRSTSTCEQRGNNCWETYDKAQIDSFVKLVTNILRRNPSLLTTDAARKESFIMHSDIITSKQDPGPLFEEQLDSIILRINQELNDQDVAQRAGATMTTQPPPSTRTSPQEEIRELADEFQYEAQEIQKDEALIGPIAWCTGEEAPASSSYAQRINQEAYNSGGQTYLQASIAAGLEYGVDPALLITHMIHESSMGQNNACTAQGKTALTGCGWTGGDKGCSKNCGCTGDNVISDKNQLRCTARTDKAAYEEAMSGQDKVIGLYEKCNEYARDPNKMWTCILCIYQGNYAEDLTKSGAPYFTKDGTCNYAERFKETYCSWNAYMTSSGAIKNYKVAGQPTSVRASATYTLPVSFETTIDVDLQKYEDIKGLAIEVMEACPDNEPQACLHEKITEHNAKHPGYKLTTTCDENAFLQEFLKQYASCAARPPGIPCSIQLHESINKPFHLRFNMTGLWEIATKKIKDIDTAVSREVYPGYNLNHLSEHGQAEERNITITFHEQGDENYADIFINNNLDTVMKNLPLKERILYVINDDQNRTALDLHSATAMPAANTSFLVCEERKQGTNVTGLVFALNLEDHLPPPVTGITANYHEELEAYELQWTPVTTYEDGTPVKDIKAYQVYCSSGSIPKQEILTGGLTSTITRSDGKSFPQASYEQQGSMSVLIDQCAGRTVGKGTLTITIIAVDAAGQYSIDYPVQSISPTTSIAGVLGVTTINPLTTIGQGTEEHVEPPLGSAGIPTGMLPEQLQPLLPLLKRYFFPASSFLDITGMLT